MPDTDPMTCIHMPLGVRGLCPVCQLEYDLCPQSWFEVGNHPAGLARWEALKAELEAQDETVVDLDDDELPF